MNEEHIGRPEPIGNKSAVDLDDITLGHGLKLEDLVDRHALEEMCQSFLELFGIPLRVFSASGRMVADVAVEQAICAYVGTTQKGRSACASTVSAVKALGPTDAEVTHPCFTGAVYRVLPLRYDDRVIGRVILGPYLPVDVKEIPRSLLTVDPGIDAAKARELLPKMPRAKAETIGKIARHLSSVLDLILFSGHRALLTTHMHLASVRESYRELTEQNAKLSESYERLKELDRLKSNFLATVSHELRTPLTSILGYSEMLAEGIAGPLNEEQNEFLQTIRDKGEQLLVLIKSLLDQSKIDSGTLSLRPADLNIGDVLVDVASTLLPAAKRKGVELTTVLDRGLPTYRGDVERLRQVFLNLAENALKFTPSGGSVRLSAGTEAANAPPEDDIGFVLFAKRPDAILVQVEDTGLGIPEKERQRIFDAFYQVDGSSTREHGGTGLGLSIVKRLVEMHGGTIAVDSNASASTVHPYFGAETGTVFTVRLPLTP